MISFRKITNVIFASLLIPVIMLFFFNAAVNQHSHLLDKRIIITHAHPYSKNIDFQNPFKSHKHTDFQYFFLSLISIPVLILVFLVLSFILNLIKKSSFKTLNYLFVNGERLILKLLRAPPDSQSYSF
jgi:hypothetical protein